jgi:hypothetical protein
MLNVQLVEPENAHNDLLPVSVAKIRIDIIWFHFSQTSILIIYHGDVVAQLLGMWWLSC